MSEQDLLEEQVLRRALRLDADERPPRFDAATLAAAVAVDRRPLIAGGIVALVASAALAYTLWLASAVVAGAFLDEAFAAALALIASAAVPAVALAETAQQPIVPTILVVALVIAILHELYARRELRHAAAS